MALICVTGAGACSGCGMCLDILHCSICGSVIFPPFYYNRYVQICKSCAIAGGSGKCVLCGSSSEMHVCVVCQKRRLQRADVIRS